MKDLTYRERTAIVCGLKELYNDVDQDYFTLEELERLIDKMVYWDE